MKVLLKNLQDKVDLKKAIGNQDVANNLDYEALYFEKCAPVPVTVTVPLRHVNQHRHLWKKAIESDRILSRHIPTI